MRRLYGFILLLCLVFALPAFSQQRWERTYGGLEDDIACSVQQTTDGGYIVAGYTWSFGNGAQIYLIKTNASGDTLWTRTLGDTSAEYGYTVQQTTDGGYVVGGTSNSFGNGAQVYLIKTNASGDTLWTRNYGGTGSDRGYTVQQTTDGGYIVAGTTNSFGNGFDDVYLIKTNASGDTLWTRTYGGTDYDWGNSVRQTIDGGYIVVGTAVTYPNCDVYLIKTNASGDTLWTRNYGGSSLDYGYSVQQTTDGGYIVAGETNSFGNNLQVYLIKTDSSGNTLWTKKYGGMVKDCGNSVQQTTDGGYIVAGTTDFFGDSSNVYLIKTNTSGDTLWTRAYEVRGYGFGNSVQQTTDGGYIVAGYTWTSGNRYQIYLIKTDANGSSGVETAEVRGQGLGIRATAKPNPFTSFATLPGHEAERFTLYDVSGRRVGTYKGDRIGEGLGAGVYFIRSSDSKDRPLRIVKVR